MKDIPYSYCQCGCGEKTKLYKASRFAKKQIKGEPAKFIAGHNTRVRTGMVRSDHPQIGQTNIWEGRSYVYLPDHPNSSKGWVLMAVLVVTNATGKALPRGTMVHHIDRDPQNNEPTNLVICQDQSYHLLIHFRTEAYRATGNANAKRCAYCGKWEIPPYKGMYIQPPSKRRRFRAYHYSCRSRSDILRHSYCSEV